MKIFESFKDINEAHLGIDYNGVDFYKNPKSIKKMKSYIRGVINRNGDLYIADTTEYIHRGVSEILARQFKEPVFEKVYKNFDKEVLVQRVASLDIFYLSESYEDNEVKKYFDEIVILCKKAKEKNPWATFVIKKIEDANLATDFKTEKII